LVLRSGSMPRRCSAVSRERRSLALWRQSGGVWRFQPRLFRVIDMLTHLLLDTLTKSIRP
jgi:hypothetical protein